MDILNRAVVFACCFKQYSIDGKTYIKNYGKAGGAPEYMMCGDGTITTGFPTPETRFGASFDGGDYIDTGVVDRYDYNNQFSLYQYGIFKQAVNPNTMAASRAVATNTPGIFYWLISGKLGIIMRGPTGQLRIDFGTSSQFSKVKSFCVTYTGDKNAKAYINSENLPVTLRTDDLNSSVKVGLSWILGGYRNSESSVTRQYIGTTYAFGIFDGVLLPRDIQLLDAYVRANIR